MNDTSLAMDTTQPSYQDYRTCKYLRENCPSRPNTHLYLDYLLRINLQLPPPLQSPTSSPDRGRRRPGV